MRRAIQYQEQLKPELLIQNGFTTIELPFGTPIREKESFDRLNVAGVIVSLKQLETVSFAEVLGYAESCQAEYIVIDTRDTAAADGLQQIITDNVKLIGRSVLEIYIENGYMWDAQGNATHTEFSEGRILTQYVEKWNNLLGQKRFGICINMGYVTLLAQNIRKLVSETRQYLRLFHMNDNDGRSDMHQLPYTFTTGRGILATDLYRAVGALIGIDYEGYLVFDTTGTFQRAPEVLQGTFLELLKGVMDVWETQEHYEELLGQPGKQIILFGAGAMAKTYLDCFGEKYPPAFLVDNNEKIWGVVREGYEIKSPEAILEIPEEERTVLICNMYYDEIALQLKKMGIRHDYFWDQYYI